MEDTSKPDEFFCVVCHFKTVDEDEYLDHVQTHEASEVPEL